ncbi:hypothetical protein [Bosea psychrotolerans]|uniref:Uncharacterized protein n=1 Tax=Bosea psychrotolerans TaxID=1871628 RepID=A0A2S4MHB5_9HYPH|nr:hypothetical protein [Bosea psychrotolerans]POR54009.1 hypothetical protein CYD53_103106 [Bosea psychrotolerans]
MADDHIVRHLPDVITHNYDPDLGRFRNLCSLSDSEAGDVLAAINASGRRVVKPNYLIRRRRTEAWLLSERTRKLGAPHLRRPIYFFFGDKADGADPSRPASVVLPLAAFADDVLTFTYPDSMASLPLATRSEHRAERKPYHGQVFTLSEIQDVVATFGMPVNSTTGDPATRFDRFIEVPVWDDRPLQVLLNQPVNQFKFLL